MFGARKSMGDTFVRRMGPNAGWGVLDQSLAQTVSLSPSRVLSRRSCEHITSLQTIHRYRMSVDRFPRFPSARRDETDCFTQVVVDWRDAAHLGGGNTSSSTHAPPP